MGLLDSLGYGNQGGYAGLLDALMYPSPLNKPQEVPQPQFDPMGNYTGVTNQPAQDPFGPPPQLAEWAKQFAPQAASAAPSPFTGTAPAVPVRQFAGVPVQPAPEPPPAPRMLGIGGYQMPQIGSAADYTPPATDFSSQTRQTPPMQAPPSPPAQAEQGIGGKALTGLQSFLNGGGLISAIRGAADGKRTDPVGIAQQNQQAQYEALVPVLGAQKARLAVTNPEAGKILMAQALESKQKFTEIGVNADGTKQYGFVNDRDQSVKPYATPGSSETSKGVAGPDGKIIPYPEGLDASGRKAFANHIATINADAATGKMTESQGKAAGFATRMENSLDVIKKFEGQGQNAFGRMSEKAPFGGAYLQSPEYQRYTAAKQSFINAHLRKDSGASIHDPEFVRAEREFFPQPGEGPDVVREKAARRAALADTTKREAGPAYKSSVAPLTLPSGWSVSVR